jgi:hypothetical protein
LTLTPEKYDICISIVVVNGVNTGKKSQVLEIIKLLAVPKFIITLTVFQLPELLTFPFSPILVNPIIGQHH